MTGRELSCEWSHRRISSTNAKVTVTFQNSVKHSDSERVNLLGTLAGGSEQRYQHCFTDLTNQD